MKPILTILWRRDGSEGIAWHIRGLREDGFFYGEIRFQSIDESKCICTFVEGQLAPAECQRMAELVDVIRSLPTLSQPNSCFAVMYERLPPTGVVNVLHWLEYHQSDEHQTESAKAFVELVELLERHLKTFYDTIIADS